MIEEIIKLAVNAPSGHNSQPWHFLVRGNDVYIWNIPDKDRILFNYKQRGSLVSNGALIENIFIIASEKGFQITCDLLPDAKDENLMAKLSFQKKTKDYEYQSLFPYILKRTTNRKPFETTPIKSSDKAVLDKFVDKYSQNLALTYDKNTIHSVSGPFSVGDRLLFENKYIHHDLFTNVNWTLEEEEKKREGLYLMTKEMSLFNRLFFKYIMSNWGYLEKLNKKIGFSAKAGEKREKLYEQASAMGIIYSNSDSAKDFIEYGRLVQRFWLLVTSLGLSYQPVSIGLLYLGQMCQDEKPMELTDNQIGLVNNAYKKILDVFNLSGKYPIFSFRIGYSEPPTFSSLKKQPKIVHEG